MTGHEASTAAASRTLSEHESKELLRGFGVPFAAERLAADAVEAREHAESIGYPVVVKLCGANIAHKTERGLVRLALRSPSEVEQASSELLDAATSDDGEVTLLVAPMLAAMRELLAGLSVDPQFGMTIMLGLGGIAAEAIEDVALRLVPIERCDAIEMIDALATQKLLGPFRGEPAVDREALVELLLSLDKAGREIVGLVSVDLNPLLIVDGRPVAVDALVELAG